MRDPIYNNYGVSRFTKVEQGLYKDCTMEQTIGIDWLSITLPIGSGYDGLKNPNAYFSGDSTQWQACKPINGYKDTYFSELGTLISYPAMTRPDMGIHIQYGGNAIRSLGQDKILSHAIHWIGAKVTRLDIKIDVMDDDFKVETLIQVLKSGEFACRTRKYFVIMSENEGLTLYVGKRTSQRSLRVYNKSAEVAAKTTANLEDLPDNWVRIELETRDDRADSIFKQICATPEQIDYIIRTAIDSYIQMVWPPWNAALKGKKTDLWSIARERRSAKKQWIVNVAIPALLDYLKVDPELKKGLIETLTKS